MWQLDYCVWLVSAWIAQKAETHQPTPFFDGYEEPQPNVILHQNIIIFGIIFQSRQFLSTPPADMPEETIESLLKLREKIMMKRVELKSRSSSGSSASKNGVEPSAKPVTYGKRPASLNSVVFVPEPEAKRPCAGDDPLSVAPSTSNNESDQPQLELLKNAVPIASDQNPSNGPFISGDVITIDD